MATQGVSLKACISGLEEGLASLDGGLCLYFDVQYITQNSCSPPSYLFFQITSHVEELSQSLGLWLLAR